MAVNNTQACVTLSVVRATILVQRAQYNHTRRLRTSEGAHTDIISESAHNSRQRLAKYEDIIQGNIM